jgi:hypothetical protein
MTPTSAQEAAGISWHGWAQHGKATYQRQVSTLVGRMLIVATTERVLGAGLMPLASMSADCRNLTSRSYLCRDETGREER